MNESFIECKTKIIEKESTQLGQNWGSNGVVRLEKWPIMYGPHSPFSTQNWPLMCEDKMFTIVVRFILQKETPHLAKYWGSYDVLKFGSNSLGTKDDL